VLIVYATLYLLDNPDVWHMCMIQLDKMNIDVSNAWNIYSIYNLFSQDAFYYVYWLSTSDNSNNLLLQFVKN